MGKAPVLIKINSNKNRFLLLLILIRTGAFPMPYAVILKQYPLSD